MRANPLLRALRVDKATLAALGATIQLHLEPGGVRRIPLYAMLSATPAELEHRARALAEGLGSSVRVRRSDAYAGGGAAPLAKLPSWALAVAAPEGATELARRLRHARPRTIARIEDGEVLVDLLTGPAERDAELGAVLAAALGLS
jgi:L-seryl-tRNA(Ser) seleniumtransferase